MYYDIPGELKPTARQEGSTVAPVVNDGIIDLAMDFSDRFSLSRLFEIRVTQIPFSQRAPAGCMQYFTEPTGIIQVHIFIVALMR